MSEVTNKYWKPQLYAIQLILYCIWIINIINDQCFIDLCFPIFFLSYHVSYLISWCQLKYYFVSLDFELHRRQNVIGINNNNWTTCFVTGYRLMPLLPSSSSLWLSYAPLLCNRWLVDVLMRALDHWSAY